MTSPNNHKGANVVSLSEWTRPSENEGLISGIDDVVPAHLALMSAIVGIPVEELEERLSVLDEGISDIAPTSVRPNLHIVQD